MKFKQWLTWCFRFIYPVYVQDLSNTDGVAVEVVQVIY